MESEQNYTHQNLDEKWPATINKQVFLTQKLAPTISFPYNTTLVGGGGGGRGLNRHDEINSWNFRHKYVVSSQYVGTRMTIPVLLVHELFALSKN